MSKLRYPEKKYLSDYDLSYEFFKELGIEVLDVIPLRKVFVLKTTTGKKILKKLDYDEERINLINDCIESLSDNFSYMMNFKVFQNNKIYKVWKNNYYVLMDLLPGREVTFTNPVEFNLSGELLGKYHLASKNSLKNIKKIIIEDSLVVKFETWINDIINLKELVETYKFKNEFDRIFLENFHDSIIEMKKSLELLTFSSYSSIRKNKENYVICHNDLAEHNFMISNEGIYLIDFDYCTIDLPIMDLCDLILKGIKNVAFEFEKAKDVINSYSSIKKLTDDEYKIMYILLLFPRDFYGIVSDYYHKKKSWDEEVFINRLKNKVENEEFRREFLKNYKEEYKKMFQ